MDDYDVLIGQLYARIQRRQLWIVPLFDLTEIHSGDCVSIELQSWIAWEVGDHHHRSCDRWNMEDFAWRFGQVLVAHRPIGCTEIDRLREDLFLPSTRADRLVIEPYGRIDLRVCIKPLRVNRIRKRRARPVDHHLRRSGCA